MDGLKKCQVCTKRIPRVGPVACEGVCMEKFIVRRDKFKKTQKYKDAQDRYWNSDKGKKTKAKIAKRFNGTKKGRIVKRRADSKFRSTDLGRAHHKVQERLRKMGNAGRNMSQKVNKWLGFESADGVQGWISKMLPDGELFEEHQIDHVIPFLAFQWKREGAKIVRNKELDEHEFKKLWNIENLQLLKGTANQSKMTDLPTDEELVKRRHLWPAWWNDTLPNIEVRSAMKSARGKSVLVC